jgi:hypothetical protein
MVKLTLITKVDDDNIFLEKNMDTIFKSAQNINLICIHNESSSETVNNNENVMFVDSINKNLFNMFDSEYTLFIDSNKKIKENQLVNIIKKLNKIDVDILMFNIKEKYVKEMKTISRITGPNTFTHEKIKDFIFKIDETVFSKIYRTDFIKNYVDEIDLTNSEQINIKTLLDAKEIVFLNETLYEEKQEYMRYINTNYFKKYVIQQNAILNYLENTIYKDASKNNYIQKLIHKFEDVGIEYKKESYSILRNSFLNLLKNKDNNYFNSLSYRDRKKFEEIIISESIEEYDLLKKVSEDKKSINCMKRYEKILESEENKIKNFNNSLISSNSWKLTKIFRLIRIKWF